MVAFPEISKLPCVLIVSVLEMRPVFTIPVVLEVLVTAKVPPTVALLVTAKVPEIYKVEPSVLVEPRERVFV